MSTPLYDPHGAAQRAADEQGRALVTQLAPGRIAIVLPKRAMSEDDIAEYITRIMRAVAKAER